MSKKAQGKNTKPKKANLPKEATSSTDLSPRQKAFLSAYLECGSVARAARAAKIYRTSHYNWLSRSPEYREAFYRARDRLADLLLDEAFERALNGSDRLLEFLLKGLKPELNSQRVEIATSGSALGAIAVWQLSDEQLDEEIKRYRKVIE